MRGQCSQLRNHELLVRARADIALDTGTAGRVPGGVAPGDLGEVRVRRDEVAECARAVLLVHALAGCQRHGRFVENQADLRALEPAEEAL